MFLNSTDPSTRDGFFSVRDFLEKAYNINLEDRHSALFGSVISTKWRYDKDGEPKVGKEKINGVMRNVFIYPFTWLEEIVTYYMNRDMNFFLNS